MVPALPRVHGSAIFSRGETQSLAIATLGTSITEDHARKLARLVPANPVVVLVYDGDSAGVKATLRASRSCSTRPFMTKKSKRSRNDGKKCVADR